MKNCNFKKFIFIALSVAVFFIACKDEEAFVDNNYAIVSLSADGSSGGRTTKLIITVNDDKRALTADDIKINASFLVIKGVLSQNGTICELPIIFGNTGTIRVGLDPYRGFTGWDAKTAYVYADWYFSGTLNLTITGCAQSVDLSNIPNEIAGKPITAIGSSAFRNKGLLSVTIPEKIITIGSSAFESNQLTEIEIPNGVTTINNNAFRYNKLTKIKIPENVSNLSGFNDNEINTVEFLSTKVTTIGSYAFENNMLSSINIPESVTTISYNAFFNNMLSSIVIPASVYYISDYAFSNNPLTSITIGANVILGSAAFGSDFEKVYNDNNKVAGKYTRPNTSSKTWTKN